MVVRKAKVKTAPIFSLKGEKKMTEKPVEHKAPEPKPLEFKVPDGAMDPKDVKPGYNPDEGSPSPSNPKVLFNPNNPNSPVTKPSNPSNPANMPQTQSDKPASEAALADMPTQGPTADQKKAKEENDKKKADLAKKLDEALKKHGNESSIPAGDLYWSELAQLRLLNNP